MVRFCTVIAMIIWMLIVIMFMIVLTYYMWLYIEKDKNNVLISDREALNLIFYTLKNKSNHSFVLLEKFKLKEMRFKPIHSFFLLARFK